MNFDNILSNAYSNWFNNVFTQKLKNNLPLISEKYINGFSEAEIEDVRNAEIVIQFAREISLETVKEYHRQLTEELRTKGIYLDE